MGLEYDLLHLLSLASAVVWSLLALWSLFGRHPRTATALFFATFCALLGLWALLDWLFLSATDLAWALLLSRVRMGVITVAIYFGILFARRLANRRGPGDLLPLLPLAGALVLAWGFTTQGAEMEPWGPRLLRDPSAYALWALWVTGATGTATAYLRRALRPLARTDPPLARRIGAILGASILTLGLWLATNIFVDPTRSTAYPSFSALLIIPGLLILAFVAPRRALRTIVRRLAVPPGGMKGVYLFDRRGNVLAAAGAAMDGPGEDRLGGILRAMEELVRRSLDQGAGGRLRTLRQEGYSIVVESGGRLVLAALVEGEPHDLLRGELREVAALLEERWGTAAAPEIHRVLEGLLRPREVF